MEHPKLLNKLRIYIAGPYTSSPLKNTYAAISVADTLLEFGYIPYVPHLFHWWEQQSPKSYDTWMELDSYWLTACDAVLRMEGESKGADAEVQLAIVRHIPVYYSLKELENAQKGSQEKTTGPTD